MWPYNLQASYTSKHMQMSNIHHLFVVSFKWSLFLYHLRWNYVYYLSCMKYNLTLKLVQNLLCFQHTSSHLKKGIISSFHHAILLWRVQCCEVPYHSMIFTQVVEFMRSELAIYICSQYTNNISAFSIFPCFEYLEVFNCVALFLQQKTPLVP